MKNNLENLSFLSNLFTKMIKSCDNQHRRYIEKHLEKIENKETKEFKDLQYLLKVSKNGFKDPYGGSFYGSGDNEEDISKQISYIFDKFDSIWEANKVFVQPFRTDNNSYSSFRDAQMRISIVKDDFGPEALCLIEQGDFVIRCGFFWFQREDCNLVSANIKFCVNSEIDETNALNKVLYEEKKIFSQANDQGMFSYQISSRGQITESGIFDGKDALDKDNPGVPGFVDAKSTKFSHLSFKYRHKKSDEAEFKMARLYILVEGEHKNLMDKFSRISSTPCITGIYFRIFPN